MNHEASYLKIASNPIKKLSCCFYSQPFFSIQSAVLRTLSHPSIIQYYGTVTEDVSYFIVTGLLIIKTLC